MSSQGTAAPAEQPCTFDWTPGQLAQAVAQFVIALGAALLRFEPARLVPLLQKHGTKLVEKLGEAIVAFIAETTLTLLPLFADVLGKGWQVIEDRGSALPDDWDPRLFLEGLTIGCVHPDGQDYMKGEDLVTEARKRLAGRGGFSQHELDWFYRHWADERIPGWFRKAVESGEIYLVATETVLLRPRGFRYVLCLCWGDGRLSWDYVGCLGRERWGRLGQVLVPGDSSELAL